MSISGKIPVVVLEMMEKLRREQKGKEQGGKNSKKPPGKSSNEIAAQIKNSNENAAQINRSKENSTHIDKEQAACTNKVQGQQQVMLSPVRKLTKQIEPVQNPLNMQPASFQTTADNQIARYQAQLNQTPRFQSSTDMHGLNMRYSGTGLRYPDTTLNYPDPPLEQVPQPYIIHMQTKPVSPTNYIPPQYHMSPMLPTFPDAFHDHLRMEPHMHSHMEHYAQYHPCTMLPHPEYHCAQGPLCHVTPYMGQPGCCMELNQCSTPTLSRMKRQPSYMQMPLSLKPPQQSLPDFGDPHSPIENLDNHLDLGVGSMVEVMVDGMPYYGVIRWLGQLYAAHGDPIAGIEMEQEHELFCDGQIQNKQRFICNPKRGHFAPLFQCRKDPRFIESHCADIPSYPPEQEFGGLSCPIIPGSVPPLSKDKNIETLCGKMRGIQGHHNSCYLDATLFAMFTFTSVFDSLLFRPPPDSDSPHYTQVQQVLREEIVNPLRKNLFVRADRVMHLRHLLNELSDVSGLTSEEKDPEEFLTSLVAQILRAEPFLKLSSGQETYHYQLFVEKDEKLRLPSVQQLFEQSFFTSDIKLKEAPSCLIIQMPRFGKSYKMYPRILPSQLLDITDVLEVSPRQCTICGKLAELECRKCFNQCDSGLQSIWYCRTCLERTHTHEKRTDHESCWRQLSLPDYFLYDQECPVSRVFMELFAVVCIETSHYVAFVKGGSGCDAPWCFFDSMADRKGERNGYNIPEMVPCPELPYWLSEEGSHQLNNITDDRQLPEYAKRLMCDAYMVMYQSPDLMMYR